MQPRVETTENVTARQRRKTRTRWLVFGFFLFIALVMILESPLSRVRGVLVQGNTSIPESDIVKYSSVKNGMSLWQVNSSRVENAVTGAEPMIESVKVNTNYFSGQVTLHVKEKQIVALLEQSGKFYRLLGDGKLYTPLQSLAGFTWPIVTSDQVNTLVAGQKSSDALTALCGQLTKVPAEQTVSLSEIHLDKFGVATVYLTNHFAVQCKAGDLANILASVNDAVKYFLGKGYAPGLIDMTGGPPYRYTPFSQSVVKENQP